MMNATSLGAFDEYQLANPAGGGIAVDQSGRTTIVGTTVSSNFPPNGGRQKNGQTHDAVRVALDMVPAGAAPGTGVGRTDGTGIPNPAGGPPGGYPMGTWFGGTTPECALTPFGHQIGLTDPQSAPTAPRLLIDWEGLPPAAGVAGAIIVSRPPNNSQLNGGFFQFTFPGTGTPPGPSVLPGNALLWTTDASAFLATWLPVGLQPLRVPFPPFPSSPGVVTVQFLCLMSPQVLGGSLGPTCTGVSDLVASPAMWINW
jgi:hypothetical protein